MSAEINSAAASLAEAKLKSEEAGGVLATASEAVEKVRGRIADIEAERAKIVSARKSGRTSPKDGARLSELDADREGLAELRTEAEAARNTAAGEATRLSQAVTAAQWALTATQNAALLAGLKERATELDGLLVEALQEIAVVARNLGMSRAPWLPSSLLATNVRRLELEGGLR